MALLYDGSIAELCKMVYPMTSQSFEVNESLDYVLYEQNISLLQPKLLVLLKGTANKILIKFNTDYFTDEKN